MWLGLLALVGCDETTPDGVPNDAFVGGTLRLDEGVEPPQNCVLLLLIPNAGEVDPIPVDRLPEQPVNLQQPLGRVDSSEVVFWITKDDADFFVDEDEFGWHAWIGCDAGIALGPASAWGAWGGAATEPFTPPKTDLSVDVAPLAAER